MSLCIYLFIFRTYIIFLCSLKKNYRCNFLFSLHPVIELWYFINSILFFHLLEYYSNYYFLSYVRYFIDSITCVFFLLYIIYSFLSLSLWWFFLLFNIIFFVQRLSHFFFYLLVFLILVYFIYLFISHGLFGGEPFILFILNFFSKVNI